jgi:predicted DNA binding CopG/RHH family protein
MKKRLPKMRTDRAARAVLKRDLSDLISQDVFKPVTFEFAPKDKSITLRVSSALLHAVQDAAKKNGKNYQKLIREAIEQYLKKAA